jgi:deoxyadenosine/deoxycytidine kinase|uniref:Deoxynucleoside kinase domain-containing protein n=1 Tax=viral metagenome TaxID=1070528 RepID=A0A6C0DKU6_9ZZZZ
MSQIISVEGNIGSGKSTLLENLREKYKNNDNIIFLKEPVDEWEDIKDNNNHTMLEKFYSDQKKYSFPFQMMAYISRLALLKNTIKQNPDKIIITERSLNTDKMVFAKMLFESGKIEDVMYKIYLKWFDCFASDFTINKIIYIRSAPLVCFHRIHERSRVGESEIPLSYLTSCDEYHENMISNSEQSSLSVEILELDGNVNIKQNVKQLELWLNEINKFIYSMK